MTNEEWNAIPPEAHRIISENATKVSESTETPGSIAAKKQKGVFSYVDITSKGCEGWLNLFVGEYCVAMVNDIEIADEIRRVAKKKRMQHHLNLEMSF